MTGMKHDRRLARGRRWWDLTSGLAEKGMHADKILDVALPELDLRPGHHVLDIGCGAGNTFDRLREAVGADGRVTGVDDSPKMVARAERRVRDRGWTNVEVRRADFTVPTLQPESIDRAIALSSITAMPDVPAAVRHAHDALRPGGLLYVFDMKLRPAGRAAPVIRFLDGVYRVVAGWTGVDVLDTARAVFAEVRLPDVPPRTGAPPRPQPEDGWPPLTVFVARKAG